MKLIRREMPPSFELNIFGDVHIGAPTFHEEGFNKLLSDLKRKNVYGLELGDAIEAKTPKMKTFSLSNLDVERGLITPQQQCDYYIKLLRPVKSKILAKGFGNHEYMLADTVNYGQYVSKELDIPYGGYTYKFIVQDPSGTIRFKLLLHHGDGILKSAAKDDIQREANQKAALKQKLNNTSISDCIGMFMGHVHKSFVVKPTYLSQACIVDRDNQHTQHLRESPHPADDWIPPDTRWYGSSGCFRMTYTSPDSDFNDYSEMKMYGASDLGYLKVKVSDYHIVEVVKIVV